MSKTKIIGLAGPKGVGKNFVADLIVEYLRDSRLEPVLQFAFATSLKEACIQVLGLRYEQCYGSDSDKNTSTSYRWDGLPGWLLEKFPDKAGYMTAREVMQVFGTEIMRDCFGKDLWIKSAYDSIKRANPGVAIITDVRFANEAEHMRSWGGSVWRISGPQRGEESAKGDRHASETESASFRCDRVINNDVGTTEDDIRRQVSDILIEDFGFAVESASIGE